MRFEEEIDYVYLKQGIPDWSVVDLDQIYEVAHKNEAGLQFADCVAGAFFEAVSLDGKTQCNTEFASALFERLYRSPRGKVIGYGVKVMPQFKRMRLQPQQRILFEKLGHSASGW